MSMPSPIKFAVGALVMMMFLGIFIVLTGPVHNKPSLNNLPAGKYIYSTSDLLNLLVVSNDGTRWSASGPFKLDDNTASVSLGPCGTHSFYQHLPNLTWLHTTPMAKPPGECIGLMLHGKPNFMVPEGFSVNPPAPKQDTKRGG